MKLINVLQLRSQLRVEFCDDDPQLEAAILSASQDVLDYLKPQGWSSFYDGTNLTADVPHNVQMATAQLAAIYFENFVSDTEGDFGAYGELPRPVVARLYRMRDPALC